MEQLLVAVGKALQVAVDAGVAVGMVDVDSVAETVVAHGQPADVSVGNGPYVPPFLVVGPDVQSAVEVPRSRFTEVAGQGDGAVDGTLVGRKVEIGVLGLMIRTSHNGCRQERRRHVP